MNKLHHIAAYIRKHGQLTNRAKSAYGADRWELGLLSTTLEDEGYTTGVFGLSVAARKTADFPTVFELGNEAELELLWETLFFDEYSS